MLTDQSVSYEKPANWAGLHDSTPSTLARASVALKMSNTAVTLCLADRAIGCVGA